MGVKTIAVILGGTSPEREISLISGREVYKAIQQLPGYKPVKYDPKTDLEKLEQDKDKIDLAFIALHGEGGEDGEIQGFLETLKIPYLGSGVKASALAIDKIASKALYKKFGLPVLPHWEMLKGDPVPKDLRLPVMVKPNTAGSSIGMAVVRAKKDLAKALRQAFKYGDKILLERYIQAQELTVPVIGQGEQARALPVVEIIPTTGEFFDYTNKYDGTTKEIVPAQISRQLTKKIKQIGLRAHQILGCKGVTRTDMLYKNGKIYVLETNTIPGLTPESLVPKSARAAGISFKELIKRLILMEIN
jgi:D-alanine-D-alanine ligase